MLALREQAGSEVAATCGKVGAMAAYPRFFGPLAGRLHTVIEEGPARSDYRFPGLGTVAFVRDADGSHTLVMLASLVGKYLRELLMGRIARSYLARGPLGIEGPTNSQGLVSGYHDPRTARFVAATGPLRAKLGVPDDCFERERRQPKGG